MHAQSLAADTLRKFTFFRTVVFAGSTLLFQPSHAQFIPTTLDVAGTRTSFANEGYLSFASNAAVGRLGQEWTGWVDVRHPSLAGGTDATAGYDRSDRHFNITTTILTDSLGDTAPSDRPKDLAFANKAFLLQTGVGFVETNNRSITSGDTGASGVVSFSFGLDNTELTSIRDGFSTGSPVVDVYYATLLDPASLAGGAFPPGGSSGNVAVFKSDLFGLGNPDTFSHELFHVAGDTNPGYSPRPTDLSHSCDSRNLIAAGQLRFSPGESYDTAVPDPTNCPGTSTNPWDVPELIDVVGPRISTSIDTNNFNNPGQPKVGGVNQLISDQAQLIFSDPDVANYLQASDNPAAGHRVDFDFVVDHRQWMNDHDGDAATSDLTFGLENLADGADNHQGVDQLYWNLGTTTSSDQSGKDKTGLGSFGGLGDASRLGFTEADVVSINALYSDSDVDIDGNLSDREQALDYQLSFELLDGTIVAGNPTAVFTDGWTANTTVENFVTRWQTPGQVLAKGVFIEALAGAHNGAFYDGITQIDAVIVNTAIPEPSSFLFLGLVGLAATSWRVARRFRRRNHWYGE